MTNEQKQRKRLEESIEYRTTFLMSQVSAGDRIAAFIELSEEIKTDPILAREFEALRRERRELEVLNGIVEIRVIAENYGTVLCKVCHQPVEIGLSGEYCMDHVPLGLEDDELLLNEEEEDF